MLNRLKKLLWEFRLDLENMIEPKKKKERMKHGFTCTYLTKVTLVKKTFGSFSWPPTVVLIFHSHFASYHIVLTYPILSNILVGVTHAIFFFCFFSDLGMSVIRKIHATGTAVGLYSAK